MQRATRAARVCAYGGELAVRRCLSFFKTFPRKNHFCFLCDILVEEHSGQRRRRSAPCDNKEGMPQELPPFLKKRLLARGINVDAVAAAEEDTRKDSEGSEEIPLPDGWSTAFDKTYNTTYWYNASTGQSSWTRPTEAMANPPLPPGWKEAKDPATGHVYFCNAVTKESSWTRPLDAAAAAQMKRCRGCGGFGKGVVQDNGYCRHCSGILLKPTKAEVPPLGGTAAQFPAVTMQPPPPRGAIGHTSGMIARGPSLPEEAQSNHGIGPQPKHEPKLTASAPRAAGSIRAMPPVASGRKRQRAADAIDPMDPSSYSDAPVGGWGAGLASSKSKEGPSGGSGRPLPSPGDVLRQNAKAEESKGQLDDKSREGLGEAD